MPPPILPNPVQPCSESRLEESQHGIRETSLGFLSCNPERMVAWRRWKQQVEKMPDSEVSLRGVTRIHWRIKHGVEEKEGNQAEVQGLGPEQLER